MNMDNNFGYEDPGKDSGENNHRTYDFYEVNRQPTVTPPPEDTDHKPHKIKKSDSGLGKKFGITITMALVFGLVAGLVFQGVNLVSSKVFGTKKNATIENVQMVPSSSDTNSNGSTTASSVSATSLSVADIAKNAMPSVVAITAVSVQEVQSFFGGTQEYEGVGSGSGIIIGQNDDELLIATNNHVVEGAKNLSVSFYGDEIDASALNSQSAQYGQNMEEVAQEYAKNSVSAQIKGTDADNDLAVIAVQKTDVPDDTMEQIKIASMGSSNEDRKSVV